MSADESDDQQSFRKAASDERDRMPRHIRPFLTEDERRAKRRPEPIGDVVDRVMTGVAGGRAGPAVVLGARWVEVVGDDFAAKTAPASCDSGRLIILVRDGSTASKMRFNTSQILQNASKIAGEGKVSSISFRVSPSLGKKSTR